jgi:hypothetical protein
MKNSRPFIVSNMKWFLRDGTTYTHYLFCLSAIELYHNHINYGTSNGHCTNEHCQKCQCNRKLNITSKINPLEVMISI